MNLNAPGMEWRAKTLRAWQLAMLRFAVTLDNADRLAVMAIAHEIDRLGSSRDGKPGFSFFRRTSAKVCLAILRPNELTPTVLRQYLTRIDDDRLKHVFAATIEPDQPQASSVSKAFKRDNRLWRGLSSGRNRQL
ncbi:MAG: hypothetical protein QOJ15_3709 [Bradyrhizobium sp.]|nr:hypothetical protein [Bradyrhizobium sp.]